MQIYSGSYLHFKDGKYFVKIPRKIIATSDFEQYSDGINIYIYAPKEEVNDIYYTDEIQVCITPQPFTEFENLYYFEVIMNNIPGSLNILLEYFYKEGINILECRAIDSVIENKGKVEIIATIDNEKTTEGRVAKGLESRLNLDYKKLIYTSEFKIPKKPITVSEPIDKLFVKGYKSIKNKSDYLTFKLDDIEILNKEYCIPLPADENILSSTIKRSKVFLGITYLSEGNYILVKFKSKNEIIVPMKVIFPTNKKGYLSKVIQPLSQIGVNLRLILPENLSEKNPEYWIYFNIENTKLNFYDKNGIEKTIRAHINNDEIKIALNKSYFSSNGKEKIQSEKYKSIINETNNLFKKEIESNIRKWIERLQSCALQNSCDKKTCTINKNWKKSKQEISDLVNQIKNSDLEGIFIPEKIKQIKSKSKLYCDFKSDFQVFLISLSQYLQKKETLVQAAKHEKNIKESNKEKKIKPKPRRNKSES